MRWTRHVTRGCAVIAVLLPVVFIYLTNQRGYNYDGTGRELAAWLMPVMIWATLIGSILFYLYAMRIAVACRSRATAISCGIVAGVLVMGMSIAIYEKAFMPSTRATFLSRSRIGTAMIGSGFLPSPSLSRNVFGNSSSIGIAVSMSINTLFQANGWWSVLTLVQLAFMSGRVIPAGSIERTAASSRP